TVSRGLSRSRESNMRHLQEADEPRRGALDGRGNLSEQSLRTFCRFFLDACIDQVHFMTEVLDLEGFQERIDGYVRISSARGELDDAARHLLRDVILRGRVARGEAPRILGMAERSARRVVTALLEKGLAQS